MAPITAEVLAAVDDTAEYAFDNIVKMRAEPANRADDKTVEQCYTALQQSLAHYRAAGKMTRDQAVKQTLLTRAAFLKAEAALMLDEQWQAFGTEMYLDDKYRASRTSPTDLSACMDCWVEWDADGHALYQALLHRAEGVEAEAKAVQS